MSRPTRAIIHAAALRHNLAVARGHAPAARAIAVVKANAYGHGLLRAARALAAADAFAVLEISEAIALREAGHAHTIVLLEGLFEPDELALALQHRLTPVVHSEPQLTLLGALGAGQRLDVFLKINSGMNRLGLPPARAAAAYRQLRDNPGIAGVTLMTHFATADEAPGIDAQLELFEHATRGIVASRTLANSATVLRHPAAHADWVRPGIMLYGATPFADVSAAQLGLQPAMTLVSEVIAVQEVARGDAVGYGRCFIAERPTRIGVVACGYADGYPRHAPNGTPVAVDGIMTRTLGRVSMDMLYVDLSDIPQAGIGSRVELWGGQVPVDAVARACGTVGYELLCALAPRVKVVED